MNHMGFKDLIQGLIEEAALSMGVAASNVRWAFSHGGAYTSKDDLQEFTSGTGSVAPGTTGTRATRAFAVTGVGVGVARGITGNIIGGWTTVTRACFVKGRIARSGTLAAGSDQHIGFQNSPFNHGVGIGVFESISATNFSVVKCASDVYTGVDTGIALTSGQVELKLYRTTAGTWFWQINTGAITSMTTTGQPTSGNEAYGHIMVTNAAAATALTLTQDYVFWAGQRTA